MKNIINTFFWTIRFFFKNAPRFSLGIFVFSIYKYRIKFILDSFLIAVIVDELIMITSGDKIDHSSLWLYVFLLVFNQLGKVIVSGLDSMFNRIMGMKFNFIILKSLYEKTIDLGPEAMEDPDVQDSINIYKNNKDALLWTFNGIVSLTGNIIIVIFSIGGILNIFPIAILLMFFATIPKSYVNKKFLSKIYQFDHDVSAEERKANSIANQMTNPAELKEIQLIGAFSYLQKYFVDFYNKKINFHISHRSKWMLAEGFFDVLIYIIVGITAVALVNEILLGNITPGQFGFYITLIWTLNTGIDGIIIEMTGILELIYRIMDIRGVIEKENNTSNQTGESIEKEAPTLELKDVSFSYPNSERKVIDTLNLKINAGEKVAIVGENGAGKSTLVKLLIGIHKPTEGEILITGKNLNSIERSQWFDNIGALFQDFNKYTDLTLKENIFIGNLKEDIDLERIKESLDKADANFINEYPEGLEQIMSEQYKGGIRPSTGQWQKIAIARFFYRNAPLLILDEPTAAIDAVAEANIFNKIYEFIENKTVIIISHRFSTVRNADRIIVFDKGHVVEDGTHEELVKQNGKYAHSFNLQAKGYV